MKTIVLSSGGLDSAVLAYSLQAQGHELVLVHVNYGQLPNEGVYVERCAWTLKVPSKYIKLSTPAFAGNALTGGGNTDIVPNRNMVLCALAGAQAVQEGADAIAIAVSQSDHQNFPDCRPLFIQGLEWVLNVATEQDIKVLTPFISWPKSRIVSLGDELGVNFKHTWSCYRNLAHHCGTCHACQERIVAFREAGVPDPTKYEKESCHAYET